MRKLLFALTVAVLPLVVGCMGPAPLQGIFFSDTRYPGYYDGAAEHGVGSKKGSAMMTSYLGMVCLGDASVAAAASAGSIRDIRTVDHHYTTTVGVIQTWTTEITGE